MPELAERTGREFAALRVITNVITRVRKYVTTLVAKRRTLPVDQLSYVVFASNEF